MLRREFHLASFTVLGGLLGWGFAHLHNLFLNAYVRLVRRTAAAAERRRLLEKV